ncbi:flagellar biosynthesis anti-sigma factor FlgM [Bordetella sp. 15P40C-2]|uniref:flagellar biosynthesis anti-sigma factor FlgM n=1 Tax=Bordetella sp. 15P40C-2 TaxID=2572246 RepID=UPI001326F266|nr:flagellar biosynthesis anti-sigma factor FlgM [Bordetella sp. 15P40C-2]MVW69998.1 flagellar biosynthesis anti-sigma factor FlgM [Bordetella sp. 15P40C-2]
MNVKQLSALGYATAAGVVKPVAQTGGDNVPAQPKSMQVALSAGSQALSEGDNDVNMERVQAIRQALADGTLKINPERIAEGLINSAKDLL